MLSPENAAKLARLAGNRAILPPPFNRVIMMILLDKWHDTWTRIHFGNMLIVSAESNSCALEQW